jgi:hypothetical protein
MTPKKTPRHKTQLKTQDLNQKTPRHKKKTPRFGCGFQNLLCLYTLVTGGIGIPTGIFRDPGPEIPVFWVSRRETRVTLIPGKCPDLKISARFLPGF